MVPVSAMRGVSGTGALRPPPRRTGGPGRAGRFVRRRQAHEALTHGVDAERAADRRTPLDHDLSADGVDEALRIMYGNLPPWGSFTPDGVGTLRLRASDTGDTWLVTVGRFTGTDPG